LSSLLRPYVPGFHIEAIAEHLEAVSRGEIQDLVITVPPRSAKSLCCSVFLPTWMWTFAPASRWLTNSYAQSLSVRDALRSRRVIESRWYQRYWGHVFALAGDQDTKHRYDNTRGGYRIAASVGGANTGEGGDWLICDDPHNIVDAESALVRESTVRWWFEVMTSRLKQLADLATDDARAQLKLVADDLIATLTDHSGKDGRNVAVTALRKRLAFVQGLLRRCDMQLAPLDTATLGPRSGTHPI
jgi:hypothetical protein